MRGSTHIMSGAATYNELAGLAGWHPSLAARIGCTVVAAGAAALCDLDQCGSTAARTYGFASNLVARAVHHLTGGHREGTHSGVGVAGFTGYSALTLAAISAPLPLIISARDTWTLSIIVHAAAAVALAVMLAFILASLIQSLTTWGRRHHHQADLAAGTLAALAVTHTTLPGMSALPAAVFVGVTAHILGDMLTEHGCPLLWPWSEHRFHLHPVKWLWFKTGHWPEHVIAAGLVAANLWFAWSTTGLAAYAATHLTAA
jgi:hypothetical protein